jgi:hypothetical protein
MFAVVAKRKPEPSRKFRDDTGGVAAADDCRR